ncbi:hypothetical protein NECAME_07270 [Necator americanus]|uniref:Uncharacterized protein n=1 Tax=Necator americanus TaxID=51031 RepID=W2TNI6_NECAM|nr:hypothetical protein NECAME_07270 [Necator americanus]ETN83665.1 hypothetical protein NECAME_07270 [Necator americanus]
MMNNRATLCLPRVSESKARRVTPQATSKNMADAQNSTDSRRVSVIEEKIKYIKILTPHVILVAVLIGYLCLGAWILMLLETRTELLARSRKLVRLTNMMSNFTADSWRILNEAQHGGRLVDEQDWAAAFR